MLRTGLCVPRLTSLHQLLQPLASCARVLQCAQAVPTLLRAFFAAVTQVSPPPRASVPTAEGQPELRGQSAAHSSRGRAPVPPECGCEQPPGQHTQRGPAHGCLWPGTQAVSPSQFADGALASQLALLLLERSDSLFPVEGYEADVHRWVSPGGSVGLHPSCGSRPPCPQLWSMQSPSPASSQAQPRHFVGCRTDSPLQSCLTLSPASFSWAAPSRRCPF